MHPLPKASRHTLHHLRRIVAHLSLQHPSVQFQIDLGGKPLQWVSLTQVFHEGSPKPRPNSVDKRGNITDIYWLVKLIDPRLLLTSNI